MCVSCITPDTRVANVSVVHQMQSLSFYSAFAGSRSSSCIDYAIANNITPFISMQNHYSMLYREEEREMVPTLKASYCHPYHLPF